MKIPAARKLKSGNWCVQLRLGGKSYTFTNSNKKQAERDAAVFKANYRNGTYDKDGNEIRVPTVKEAVATYIEERSNILSPSTIKGYTNVVKNRFDSVMDKSCDTDINWQKLINDESSSCSAKTLKNAWSVVRASVINAGYQVPSVRLPQIVPNEHPYLSPDEIKVFLKAIKGHKHEVAMLLGLHGLRMSEMCAMTKDNIYDGTIHVRGATVIDVNGKLVDKPTNKNSTSRRDVPIMIDRLQELVDNAPDGKLYVNYPSRVYEAVNSICQKNKLPLIGFHGLRHSFASLCASLGISESETMKLGGWSSPNVMRRIYTHVSDKEKQKAANKIKDFFDT